MVRFVPYGPRVLLRPDEAVSSTGGGILLPEKAQKPPTKGVVVALGYGNWYDQNEPLSELKWPDGTPVAPGVGDRVYYSQYQTHTIQLGDEKLVVLSLEHILGIVVEDEPEPSNKGMV